MSLKNKVYIILSFVLVVFMILLTFLYLNSHKKDITSTSKIVSSSDSTSIVDKSTSVTSSSVDNVVEKSSSSVSSTTAESTVTPDDTNKRSEKKEVTPTKETEPNTDTKNKDNHEYVSNYRYVYEAVGDDDFTVVSKLTGVDVDTLAKANSLSKDIVFKKGDRIFVP